MLRFSIRELLWLTLVVAALTAWRVESARTEQWRQRAEIAANQLEAENLGKLVFQNNGVHYHSFHYSPPFQDVYFPVSSER